MVRAIYRILETADQISSHGNPDPPTMNWVGIQKMLEQAESDVLILLDCWAGAPVLKPSRQPCPSEPQPAMSAALLLLLLLHPHLATGRAIIVGRVSCRSTIMRYVLILPAGAAKTATLASTEKAASHAQSQ